MIFQVAESVGFHPTGSYFQLNSYENRVFDIELESDGTALPFNSRVICKVYRPGRWSQTAILEEHQFLQELQEAGIPAIAPLCPHGQSLHIFKDLFFCFFPKARGRMPQELQLQDFESLGQQLAKLHNVGAQRTAPHRPFFDVEVMGWDCLDRLQDWVAPEVAQRYDDAGAVILNYLEERTDGYPLIRIHGDCHRGNILQTDPVRGAKELFFVDFDDCINGIPVQDFWMLFSGDEKETQEEQSSFLRGYNSLRHFDHLTLSWMPALRGLRIIYYADWIARRWQDPSFPKLFPNFRNYIYWVEEVEALEKIAWSLKESR